MAFPRYVKVSALLRAAERFPMRGVDGYGGEQDGSTVLLAGPFEAKTKAAADAMLGTMPEYVRCHHAQYTPGRGWYFVLGMWSNAARRFDGDGEEHFAGRTKGTERPVFD